MLGSEQEVYFCLWIHGPKYTCIIDMKFRRRPRYLEALSLSLSLFLALSVQIDLQIKWNLVSGNTNPNRFYLQEFWWVKTILETYGWRYWIIIHERVGKERDEMRFKTKPRQNPKGDQLGTWDFRDNVWDTYISVWTWVNPCYPLMERHLFCWEGLKKTTNALICLTVLHFNAVKSETTYLWCVYVCVCKVRVEVWPRVWWELPVRQEHGK